MCVCVCVCVCDCVCAHALLPSEHINDSLPLFLPSFLLHPPWRTHAADDPSHASLGHPQCALSGHPLCRVFSVFQCIAVSKTGTHNAHLHPLTPTFTHFHPRCALSGHPLCRVFQYMLVHYSVQCMQCSAVTSEHSVQLYHNDTTACYTIMTQLHVTQC